MNDSPIAPPSSPKPVNRWRIVPAALLSIFGSVLFAASILSLLLHVFGFRPAGAIHGIPPHFVVGTALMAAAAICCIVSAVLWWKQKTAIAVVCTMISYLLGVCAASLVFPMMKS